MTSNKEGISRMSDSYWDRYWRRNSSRRRFLQGSAGVGIGAASLALVGCGGGDDDDDDLLLPTATPTAGGADPSATPADFFANAKRGGTYLGDTTGDPPTIDPFAATSFLTKGIAGYTYSRLYKYRTGPGIDPLEVRPTPDIAESAEPNDDGTEWVIKLRPGVKFHNKPPVNGREVTADDVVFSFNRLKAPTAPNAGQITFIERVEKVDDSSVKFVLNEPNGAFLDVLADTNLLYIMPQEADGGFDPKLDMIGSGPWIFRNYQSGVKFEFERNPEWYMEGFPFFDKVEISIVSEYAARMANFIANRSYAFGANADDLEAVRREQRDGVFTNITGQTLSFYYFEPGGPFIQDERLRQAVSLATNREELFELGYNVSKLQDAGFDIQTPYHNILPAGSRPWWLDPESSDMGAGAAYFKYDPAEAKKLIEAAGLTGGLRYQWAGAVYGKTFDTIAEQQVNYLREVGLNIDDVQVQNYQAEYIPQTFIGNFSGIAFGYETPFPEAGSYPRRQFSPTDPTNHSKIDDPELWDLAQRQQRELNEETRKELFWELQRKHGEKMWYVPGITGAGPAWTVYNARLKGAPEYRTKGYGTGTEELPFRWLEG